MNKKRKFSVLARRNMSLGQLGKSHSQKTKNKISKSMKLLRKIIKPANYKARVIHDHRRI